MVFSQTANLHHFDSIDLLFEQITEVYENKLDYFSKVLAMNDHNVHLVFFSNDLPRGSKSQTFPDPLAHAQSPAFSILHKAFHTRNIVKQGNKIQRCSLRFQKAMQQLFFITSRCLHGRIAPETGRLSQDAFMEER